MASAHAARAVTATAATAAAAAPAARRKLYTLVLLAEKAGGEAGASTSAASCSGAVAPLPLASACPTAAAAASTAVPFASPYSRLLLGMKKRGFGAGKWNGFGGKIEPGETPRQAALREIKEEAFIDVDESSLSKRAVVLQEFVNDPVLLEVHVYLAHKYTGTPAESDEMRPQWFPVSSLPFSSMWADDEFWYPTLLAETAPRFRAHFLFRDQECLLSHTLTHMSDDERADMERLDRVVSVPIAPATTLHAQPAPLASASSLAV